jgi:hypothetical protein
MKTIKIGIAVLIGLSAGLQANQGERKGGNGELFAKLDANSDGVVSKAEWLQGPAKNIAGEGKADSRFAKVDNNNDGALDANEWKATRGGKHHGKGQAGKGGAGKGKGAPGKGGAGRGKGGAGKGGR